MTVPLIFRAAHLHLFLDLFREIGVPVESALARSALPGAIEEMPDAYVSLPLALPWMAQTGRDLTPMELGFLASRAVSLGSLDVRLQGSLGAAVSGYERIVRALRLAAIEDSALAAGVRWDRGRLRLYTSMPRLAGHPHACIVEWVNLQAMIAVVQSVAGQGWAPVEMTFVSRAGVPDAALGAFDRTRVLVGQRLTSILVEPAALALAARDDPHSVADGARGKLPGGETAEVWTFPAALRSAIQPYLAEGPVGLAQAAEMARMSPRTLQRRLRHSGTSFAETVQQARFDLARGWLSDASLKVSDVALMAGYENPQHFSRAFRKFSGLTPSDFRQLTSAS
ncbi:AraC family transcriptional regulator [Acuticoccus sediminis]|uniref:AraC family transcriptional regulator n=1 Tax=Acuticoccus sediminis TaxID=2184697 RepID=A0A8B2NVP7_9HYPH|nr:helix-turn-helix transcriptional regulator [Acuticoccus sediminis]RAI01833.1 AraC family transcriptional regulator [Acuticoccus sediminis]